MASSNGHKEYDVDMTNATRGVWLVKVPKYIARQLEKARANMEVGKLKIEKTPGQRAEITLSLSDNCMSLKEPEEDIPKNHKLDVSTVNHQKIYIFSDRIAKGNEDAEPEKLYMEGTVVQKLEFRPEADKCYMNMKKECIKKASVPHRQVRHLDKVVQNYKPVSDHKHNIEYAEKKKAEGKKMRDNKDAVMEVLFGAFERHQYYNIRDLVKITKQPVVYLKEILNEVCNYNLKNPHRNMWELKPEYRYYKKEDSSDEKPGRSTD